jgi:hypothetical protein
MSPASGNVVNDAAEKASVLFFEKKKKNTFANCGG